MMRLPALLSLSVIKRVSFIALLLFFSFVTLSPTSVHAQSQFATPNVDANVDQNQHTFVQSAMIEVMSAVICQLSGNDMITNKPCLGINPQTNKIGYTPTTNDAPGGLLGMVSGSIGSMYVIPVHSSSYVRYLSQNFGVTKPSYAQALEGGGGASTVTQNTGFEQLDIMLSFWRVFRDIAYLGFVVAFVIIGLAIMLRVKIDPRTVMTIQNQLPKIVITMIMITFSYSIVAFCVDMMWATTYLTINIFDSVDKTNTTNGKERVDSGIIIQNLVATPLSFYGALTQNVADGYTKNSPKDIAAGPVAISRRVGETIGDMAKAVSIFRDPGKCGIGIKVAGISAGDGEITNCFGVGANYLLQWAASIIGTLVVLVAILFTLFKVWFMLLRSFAYIIIYTALAPLYLFMGIFPGSSFGFDPWIRGIISNLLVFPACIAVLLAGRIFMNSTNGNTLTFNPPLIGTPTDGTSGLGFIIGFSFLLILPHMLDMVREALKSNPNKYVAPAIIGGFKAGASGASALPSKMWSKTFERDSKGEMKSSIGRFFTYAKGDAAHMAPAAINKALTPVRAVTRFVTGAKAPGSSEHHAPVTVTQRPPAQGTTNSTQGTAQQTTTTPTTPPQGGNNP